MILNRKFLILYICVIAWCFVHSNSSSIDKFVFDPDELRSFRELIESRGLFLQEYHVITQDGYILTVHRVVPLDFDPSTYNVFRKPIIAFHGVLCDSSFFYFNSPFTHSNNSYCGDNFGLCALKSGRYDLWVPNARGNRFSRDHWKYTDKDKRFWEFSWDDIALKDIPAIVNLVRGITGHRTVGWIGYSQGAGTMFALLATRPEYAQIIRPFICWAPAVFIHHAFSIMAPLLDVYSQTLNKLTGEHFMSSSVNNHMYQYGLCRGAVGNELCTLILEGFFGKTNSLNKTRVTTYFHHFPASSSNYQIAHWGQLRISGRFTRFDHGSIEKNIRAYGQANPPEFHLRKIPKNIPIIIMYGQTDSLVTVPDAKRLIRTLKSNGNKVIGHRIPKDKWSHMDFLAGMGAGRLVYDPTLLYLDLFS